MCWADMLARLQLLLCLLALLVPLSRAAPTESNANNTVPLGLHCPNYVPGSKTYNFMWDLTNNLHDSLDIPVNFTLSTSEKLRVKNSWINGFVPPQGITIKNQAVTVDIPSDISSSSSSVSILVHADNIATNKTITGSCHLTTQPSQLTSSSSESVPSSVKGTPMSMSKGAIAGIAVAVSLILIILGILLIYIRRKKRKRLQDVECLKASVSPFIDKDLPPVLTIRNSDEGESVQDTSSSRPRRRDIDAGSVLPSERSTLPPDYGQVFRNSDTAQRLASGARALESKMM